MKTMSRLGVFAVLLICLFSAMISVAAAETLYIGGSPDTSLRSDESTTKPYLARMPYGTEVELVWEDKVDGVMWSFCLPTLSVALLARHLRSVHSSPA